MTAKQQRFHSYHLAPFYRTWLLFICIISLAKFSDLSAQLSYPVKVNTYIDPPSSPYFDDYFSTSSNKWKSTILFNDFSEPAWEVKFRITIESNNLKIQTKQDFIPSSPIRIFPGIPLIISGPELASYFQYNNLLLNGISASELSTNGKFPEGLYSFCIEVLDYESGTVLSEKSCTNLWIQLNDEPISVTPICGAVLPPSPSQNIIFQWHQSNAVSPNSQGTEYQLSLYEITDPTVQPLLSIQNNKVLKIFESDFMTQNTFIYDMTSPLLDPGKKYVYTIQARDQEGKDIFKNKGTSQPCWFWYGYPIGGLINPKSPANMSVTKFNDPAYFKWACPDKILPGQYFSYHLRVVEIDSSQTVENAINMNPVWYEEHTINSNRHASTFEVAISKKPTPLTTYAWQVKAFTGEQQIAESPIYIFQGPGVIESFLAGDHEVIVSTTENKDLNHLNGTGLVEISKDGKRQTVRFENMRIIKVAGRYVLDYGSITTDLTDTSSIELSPGLKENLSAYFHPKKMRLDKNSLELYGYVSWQLPHLTSSFRTATATSKSDWINFDKLKLNGGMLLNTRNYFTLLDPYNFGLNLFTSSDFLINNNKYYLRLDGEVILPDNIRGTELNSGNVKLPFKKADQLYYITIPQISLSNNILPLPYSNLAMTPDSYIIDFSEQKSPLKIGEDVEWKGVYFTKFSLNFNTNTDKYGQLILKKTISEQYELSSKDSYKNWIGSNGLNLSVRKKFTSADQVIFNKFPATLKLLELNIDKGSVQNSLFTGNIIIPFISTTNQFNFTIPVSNTGIQPGYLDSLDGTTFTFNKGAGEQEILIRITRAVFADRERLDMTMDLEWPSLDLSVKSLTGFKAWGNYKIGFLLPNGTMSFSTQVTGSLSNYPVTFDGIGAGSSNGAYAFGITGKALLAEDVSGEQGPPSINIYSTVPNAMLPQIPYLPDSDPLINNNFNSGTIEGNSFEDNVEIIKNNLVDKLYQNTGEAEENNSVLTGNYEEDNSSSNYDPSELIDEQESQEKDPKWGSIDFTFNQQALIEEILTTTTIVITQPFTENISSKANEQIGFFSNKIDKVRDSINIKIDRGVHKLLDTLAARISRKIKTENFDATEEVKTLADSIANKLSREIQGNIAISIDNNIKNPLTSFINNEITGRTNDVIRDEARSAFTNLLDGKININRIIIDLAAEIPDIINDIGKDVLEAINRDKLRGTIVKMGDDALGNIRIKEIDDILIHAIDAKASKIISNKISNMASDAVNNLTNKIMNENGNVSGNLGLGAKMNFQNLGRNLKEGRVDKIVKLDAVSIKLKTKFVSFEGLIKYTADDGTYGDIWKGDVILTVNLPKKFELGGIYINGRKDDMPYWFCQISGVDKTDKPGTAMDKSAKPLSQSVALGPVNLVGASGRLYHHMTDKAGYGILPDAKTKYGAFVNFVFFDARNKGTAMRLAVGAGVEIKEDGNYVIDFEGDVEVGNKNPQVTISDPLAMGAGGLSLNYNSAESHFLGKGWLEIKSKALCASGNFMVDVKPGYWTVQIGTRDNMLKITPGCIGWGAAGWIGVNQTTANIGLGLSYSISTDFGLNLKVVKGGLHIDAGIAAGIQATAQYKPDFKLLQAGVWIDLWADIEVYYSTPAKSGSFNLVSISCKGDLLMTFDPPPTNLAGTLYGHIEVLCFGVDFDAGFEKTLN
jgi:hypothetical protein